MRSVQIIRHASTRLNNDEPSIDRLRGHSDIPLSAQGLEQARKLALEVAAHPPDVMLCSDLNRCVVTAKIIAQRLGVTLEEPLFALRPWDVGDFTGCKALDVLPIMMGYVTETPDKPLPGGESFNTFRNRFVGGVRNALAKYDGLIAIVTHNRSERLLRALEAAGWNGSIDVATFRQRGAPTGYCGVMEIPEWIGWEHDYEVHGVHPDLQPRPHD